MTDRYINYNAELEMNTDSRIEDILKEVGKDDEIIITMERDDADNSGYIVDMLKDKGFEVLPKGGHDDGQYHIIARRKQS